MIRVSVMYANTPGARFDHEYFKNKHMPKIQELLGESCISYTIDKGLAGGEPDSPPPFIGMVHVLSDSVESFQAGMGPHAEEIFADIKNYTDLSPLFQFSDAVV